MRPLSELGISALLSSRVLSELRISDLPTSRALSDLRISALPRSRALLELRISALPNNSFEKISEGGMVGVIGGGIMDFVVDRKSHCSSGV